MQHFLAFYSALVRAAGDARPPKTFFLVFMAFLALFAYTLHELPYILHETPPVIRAYRETNTAGFTNGR